MLFLGRGIGKDTRAFLTPRMFGRGAAVLQDGCFVDEVCPAEPAEVSFAAGFDEATSDVHHRDEP